VPRLTRRDVFTKRDIAAAALRIGGEGHPVILDERHGDIVAFGMLKPYVLPGSPPAWTALATLSLTDWGPRGPGDLVAVHDVGEHWRLRPRRVTDLPDGPELLTVVALLPDPSGRGLAPPPPPRRGRALPLPV
jgi:hypothetical protein